MTSPFTAVRDGVRVNLDADERAFVVHLLGQLDELLDDGLAESDDPLAALVGMRGTDSELPGDQAQPETPQDPALARLLPDGNRDDPEVSAEYRRLTEYGLRSRKRSAARLAGEALARQGPVVLIAEESLALLKALTDLRLVLGERLELRTDEDADHLHTRLWSGDGSEAWLATASIYEVLTSWQDCLVEAVSKNG